MITNSLVVQKIPQGVKNVFPLTKHLCTNICFQIITILHCIIRDNFKHFLKLIPLGQWWLISQVEVSSHIVSLFSLFHCL